MLFWPIQRLALRSILKDGALKEALNLNNPVME